MSKNIKKNSKNKKNNLNNYKIESLEPRLLMDASVDDWNKDVDAVTVSENLNVSYSIKQLENSSNEVFKKSGMFVLH